MIFVISFTFTTKPKFPSLVALVSNTNYFFLAKIMSSLNNRLKKSFNCKHFFLRQVEFKEAKIFFPFLFGKFLEVENLDEKNLNKYIVSEMELFAISMVINVKLTIKKTLRNENFVEQKPRNLDENSLIGFKFSFISCHDNRAKKSQL